MNIEEEKEESNTELDSTPQEPIGTELLLEQMEEAKRELDQFRNLLLRVQADSVNYKRRVEDEREELQKRANANLVLRLLPVLDDFERALQYTTSDGTFQPLMDGVELVYRNLVGVLETFGVTPIEAKDKDFNPMEHESVSYTLTEDQQDGKVMSIVRVGYKLHGRVLRPTQVIVSKKKDDDGSSHDTTPDPSRKETE